MNRRFEDLVRLYEEEGARKKFEKICAAILQAKHGDRAVHQDFPNGDDGVDIRVENPDGSFAAYQCKFFLGKINSSRKKQIKDSFKTAIKKNPNMSSWSLCLPKNLSKQEDQWWSKFRNENQEKHPKIRINLWRGDCLMNLYREHCNNHYKETFRGDLIIYMLANVPGSEEKLNESQTLERISLPFSNMAEDKATEFHELYNQAQEQFIEGQHERALVTVRKGLGLAYPMENEFLVYLLHNLQSQIYYNRDDIELIQHLGTYIISQLNQKQNLSREESMLKIQLFQQLAKSFWKIRKPDKALKLLEKGKEELAKQDTRTMTLEEKYNIAKLYHTYGLTYSSKNILNLSISNYKRAIRIKEELLNTDFANYANSYAATCSNLGFVFKKDWNIDRADEFYQKAITIREKLLSSDPTNPKYRRALTFPQLNLAALFRERGELVNALNLLKKIETERQKLYREQSNSLNTRLLANIYRNLANCYFYLREYETAEDYYEKALYHYEEFPQDKATKKDKQDCLCFSLKCLYERGSTNILKNRVKELIPQFEKRLDNDDRVALNRLLTCYRYLAKVNLDNDEPVRARENLQKALEIYQKIKKKEDFYPKPFEEDYALVQMELVRVYAKMNQMSEATAAYEASLTRMTKIYELNPYPKYEAYLTQLKELKEQYGI